MSDDSGSTSKTIVILASLDTKPKLANYLKSSIENKGFDVVLLDIGYGGPAKTQATITAESVAEAAGGDIGSVMSNLDVGEASQLMMNGAIILTNRLVQQGRCDGIVSFGGVSNATVATGVMQTIPVGVPKVMVSSAAAMPAYSARFFGSRDITMINALVDFSGLNELTQGFLDAAAGAVCGMADATNGPISVQADTRLIAVTGFRFSEVCTRAVIAGLEARGYNAIPIHAQGVGENALEDLLTQGLFDGVVDIVPAGMAEYLLGGNRAARHDRLEAAGRAGIPQVIATSGFDMLSCGPLSRRDSGDPLWEERKLRNRAFHVPDRFRVQVRTTAAEVAEIGRHMGVKLSKAKGPTRVIVPTRGWSSLSTEGEQLFDPESDAALVPALRGALTTDITVEELDLELNSDEFAAALVNALHEMLETTPPPARANTQ